MLRTSIKEKTTDFRVNMIEAKVGTFYDLNGRRCRVKGNVCILSSREYQTCNRVFIHTKRDQINETSIIKG